MNKTPVRLATSLALSLALAGCAGANVALAKLNNSLAETNAALAQVNAGDYHPVGNAYTPPRAAPVISPAVRKEVMAAVLKSAEVQGGPNLVQDVKQAAPAVQALIGSFMTNGTPCGAEMYKATGVNLGLGGRSCGAEFGDPNAAWPTNAPKGQPLEIQSVGKWKSDSANSFSFVTNLCSPLSQTCVTVGGVFVNMGQGWQVKQTISSY